MLRRIGFLLIAAVAVQGLAGRAHAQSCVSLQAELNTLQSRGGGGGGDRYERAFREQGNVIARTEARARDAGCFGGGGFLFFRRDQQAACGVLLPKLRQMQVNLARLDRLRRRAGNNRDNARIRQLQRALSRGECADEPADRYEAAAPPNADFGESYSSSGTYRTLCVRTCDGYYFPISFSTTREQFGADAQTCSAMCPAADSQLFYYPNPNGGPSDMVSLTGTNYTSLTTAFQYRTSLSPSCSCRPAGGYSPIPANPTASDEPRIRADTGPLLPRPRPEPGEDPETLANRLGDLRPGRPAVASMPGAITTAGGRSVRVVGDAYWGAPKEDGVVISPVPN